MADKGQTETGPYSQIVLTDRVTSASDTPMPLSVRGDKTTGLFPTGSGLGFASGGTQVAAFTSSGFTQMAWSSSAPLSATGTTRADALQLTNLINYVDTAAASTGVILPTAASVGVGGSVYVFNAGANVLKVYANGSETIDGTVGSSGVSLTNAKRCEYFVKTATTWISAQLGVVSA